MGCAADLYTAGMLAVSQGLQYKRHYLLEPIDEMVSVEFGRRQVVIPIAHRDATHPGSMCGLDIMYVVADHNRLTQADAKLSNSFEHWFRARLSVWQAVTAHDGQKVIGKG